MAPTVIAGAAVLGTGLQVGGILASASAEADAARENAKIAERNAQFVELQSEQDVDRYLEEAERIQSDARAQIGARGIALAGTAIDVLRSNALAVERDVERIREIAEREAEIIRLGGQQQAQFASSAFTSGLLQAGGALFGRIGFINLPQGSGNTVNPPQRGLSSLESRSPASTTALPSAPSPFGSNILRRTGR